eukprot:gene23302-11861_t
MNSPADFFQILPFKKAKKLCWSRQTTMSHIRKVNTDPVSNLMNMLQYKAPGLGNRPDHLYDVEQSEHIGGLGSPRYRCQVVFLNTSESWRASGMPDECGWSEWCRSKKEAKRECATLALGILLRGGQPHDAMANPLEIRVHKPASHRTGGKFADSKSWSDTWVANDEYGAKRNVRRGGGRGQLVADPEVALQLPHGIGATPQPQQWLRAKSNVKLSEVSEHHPIIQSARLEQARAE